MKKLGLTAVLVTIGLGATDAYAGDPISWEIGDEHACILNDCGISHCWGGVNQFYQEDLSAMGGPWVDVAVGTDNSCVLEPNGFVDCWGRHHEGQLNPPFADFESIDGGNLHLCGVRTGGEVACWGSDTFGESSGVRPSTFYRQVSAGADFTCAVTSGRNAIDCWGAVPSGVHRILSWDFLRNHGTSGGFTPERFDSVSAGHDHVCFRTTYNDLYCWGDYFLERLAPNLNGDASQPFGGECVGGEPGTPPEDCVSSPGSMESELDDPSKFALFRTDFGYTWLDVDAAGLGTCGVHYDPAIGQNNVLCWGYPYEYGWGHRLSTQPGWPSGFSPTNVDISAHNSCAWSIWTGETFCAADSPASTLDAVPAITSCEPQNW